MISVGKILDNKNIPLPGVTVLLIDMATSLQVSSYITDAGGDVQIETPTLNYKVIFSKAGYSTLSFNLSELTTNGWNVVMNKSFNLLPIGLGLAGIYFLSKRNKQVGKIEKNDLILAGGGLVGFILINKLIKVLGLGMNPANAEQTNVNSPWKPIYWRQFTSFSYVINEAQAQQFSKTIHNAFTLINDDYNAILSVFNQLRTKANVSYLSDIFSRTYNEDLLGFLGDGGGILPWDGLSQDHMQTLINYVNKLPNN